jgi:hypothetical protein
MTNRLYYGDNLDVLREHMADASIDLMPTKGMRDEAASHELIETDFGRFPALQFVTLAELMKGQKLNLPPLISPIKTAARVETRASHQNGPQGSLL